MADIYKILGEKPKHYDATERMIGICRRAYRDEPDWYTQEEGVRTLGFTSEVCSELSRLTTMNIEIAITGSDRANWLKAVVDGLDLRRWVEYGLAEGNLILKPNGTGIDKVLPDQIQILRAEEHGVQHPRAFGGGFFLHAVAPELPGPPAGEDHRAQCLLPVLAVDLRLQIRKGRSEADQLRCPLGAEAAAGA